MPKLRSFPAVAQTLAGVHKGTRFLYVSGAGNNTGAGDASNGGKNIASNNSLTDVANDKSSSSAGTAVPSSSGCCDRR